MAAFQGWKVRKAVNTLSAEIRDFVNSEDPRLRSQYRIKFLLLFDKVIENKYWLSCKSEQLRALREPPPSKPLIVQH